MCVRVHACLCACVQVVGDWQDTCKYIFILHIYSQMTALKWKGSGHCIKIIYSVIKSCIGIHIPLLL